MQYFTIRKPIKAFWTVDRKLYEELNPDTPIILACSSYAYGKSTLHRPYTKYRDTVVLTPDGRVQYWLWYTRIAERDIDSNYLTLTTKIYNTNLTNDRLRGILSYWTVWLENLEKKTVFEYLVVSKRVNGLALRISLKYVDDVADELNIPIEKLFGDIHVPKVLRHGIVLDLNDRYLGLRDYIKEYARTPRWVSISRRLAKAKGISVLFKNGIKLRTENVEYSPYTFRIRGIEQMVIDDGIKTYIRMPMELLRDGTLLVDMSLNPELKVLEEAHNLAGEWIALVCLVSKVYAVESKTELITRYHILDVAVIGKENGEYWMLHVPPFYILSSLNKALKWIMGLNDRTYLVTQA